MIFLLFLLSYTNTICGVFGFHGYVLVSCLPLRATNSPRKGSNLWGPRSGSAPARRRPHCRPRHGRLPIRQRNSVAPCGWRRREASHPRALRFSPTKTPGIRRRRNDRAEGSNEAPPVATAAREENRTKTKTAQAFSFFAPLGAVLFWFFRVPLGGRVLRRNVPPSGNDSFLLPKH